MSKHIHVRIAVLLAILLLSAASVQAQALPPGLSAWWTFEPASDNTTIEQASGQPTTVFSRFHDPEWVEGVEGMALRLDGYSTWLSTALQAGLEPEEALTVEAWVAMEAYPVTNAPFVNHYTFPNAGYYFGMDPWGMWYLAVSINGTWRTCWAAEPFPKDEWVHAAGTFDSATGQMKVYLNGQVVGSLTVPTTPLTVDIATTTDLGRDLHSAALGIFETGLINGLIDEVKIYHRALSDAEILASSQAPGSVPVPDLEVPESRFADDLHRPRYHPLPPANWTNEPHGLVQWNGAYHLFHQRNANGPYLDQIHWGHMVSRDLVQWEQFPMALAPEPGWDHRGTWAGDAVVDNGDLKLIYTGVDGVKAGIGIATTSDAEGRTFIKDTSNPVIPAAPAGSMDFRDPYLWREGGTWYMIIGSGLPGQGGTAFLYTSSDLIQWMPQGSLFSGNRQTSGIFWELPILVPLGQGKYLFGVTTVEDQARARYLYWIGTWDGSQFTPDNPTPQPLDLFNHFLSPTVTEDEQGRQVAIGIIPERRTSQAQLAAGWANLFSLPRLWSLCDDGNTLCQAPAPELAKLRDTHMHYDNVSVASGSSGHLPDLAGAQLEIIVELDAGDAQQFGLTLRQSPDGREVTRLFYNAAIQTLNLDLSQSTLSTAAFDKEMKSTTYRLPADEPLRLHVFIDHSVLEVFVNDRAAFTARIYPTLESSTGIDLFASGGTATATVDVWALRDADDAATGTASERHPPELPTGIRLDQNYPNPFNGETAISFTVDAPRHVRLVVYDMMGRVVNTLLDTTAPSGTHTTTWDGRDASGQRVASGAYFYRLQVGESASTRQMILIR